MGTPREILIECVQVGSAIRVTAVDNETGTEVVFQAPASTNKITIQRIAADKIRYVLAKTKADF